MALLHDNVPSHTSKLAKDTLKSLGWDIQSFDLAKSDYHLFASMEYAFAEQHFSNFKVGKWLNECFASNEQFFWRGIYNLLERWSKCVEADGQSFE